MDNPPWDDEDVSGSEGNVLVHGYEMRHQGVRQMMFIMSMDQGHTTKASRTTTTITNVKVEVGRHYNELCYRLFSYNKWEQFNLGNSQSFDEVSAFYSDQEYIFYGQNGRYLREKDCSTTLDSSVHYIRLRSKIRIKILAITSKSNGDKIKFEHGFLPTD